MKTKSVAALLQAARGSFQSSGITSSALDARLLLQAAANLTHEQIIAEADALLDPRSIGVFENYVSRRMKFEPVSRILGLREFYGRRFRVTPDVLDPRADTECVVELALKLLPDQATFLDLGTGSGCIAITLCAEQESVHGMASDLSQSALHVAQQNAVANNVAAQIQFHQGAWFENIKEKFDLIISNPPYIKSDAALMPDVANYDPHLALFGGEDGLTAYREIAVGAAAHLRPQGIVVVEIGAGQENDVTEIFSAQKFRLAKSATDLANHVRALAFTRY